MNGVVAIVRAAHTPVGSFVGSLLREEALKVKRRNAKQGLPPCASVAAGAWPYAKRGEVGTDG